MSILNVKASIACEYVALGNANKHTLVNVYGGGILVQNFPATFPVAFYIEVTSSIESGTPIKLEVQLNRKTLAEAVSELPPLPEGTDSFVIALPAIPIVVEKPTEIRIVASAEGHRRMTLFSKQIRQAQLPV
jgi:hypothetical protein